MRLQEAARGEAWMTDEERALMRRFVTAIRRYFTTRGVQESPLLGLRVADVGIHLVVARRVEYALFPAADADGAGKMEISGALAEQVGKARERLRKAFRELEDACARLGTPVDTGIADRMLPVVRQTGDLLHGFEQPGERSACAQ